MTKNKQLSVHGEAFSGLYLEKSDLKRSEPFHLIEIGWVQLFRSNEKPKQTSVLNQILLNPN